VAKSPADGIFGKDRDISFYDTNFDGTFDLKGYHPDGELAASRYEKYAAR
jgi:hypothetical protein